MFDNVADQGVRADGVAVIAWRWCRARAIAFALVLETAEGMEILIAILAMEGSLDAKMGIRIRVGGERCCRWLAGMTLGSRDGW